MKVSSRLEVEIEKVREEMHGLINLYNTTVAEEVIKKSQQLDKLIALKQQEGLYAN